MMDEISLAALLEGPEPVEPDADFAQDKQTPTRPAQPEHSDLEFPGWIWAMMFAGYATFFMSLVVATGKDASTLFALVVSIGYTVIYFSAAGMLVGLRQSGRTSPFSRGLAPLQTYTGPMSISAVFGQVLVIPLCLAAFGVAIAIICAFVM